MQDSSQSLPYRVNRDPTLRIPAGSEVIAATRYQPVGTDEPVPTLLMYVPYHKDDYITYGAYDPLNLYLAGHGYEVVVADMVGTGASSGTISEMFTDREGEDAAELIEWIADQDWTNGRVGMFGKSYGGITALYAASEQPEPLDAIVPVLTPYLGYRNGYTYGGLFELQSIGMGWLTSMQALDVKPPGRRDDDGHWLDVWQERLDAVRDRPPWLLQFLPHDAKDDYWADKDILVEKIRTPTFAVGGWRDSYIVDTVRFFESIDAPKRVLIGPWRHTMPHRGRESAIDFRRQVLEWFNAFLKDDDNGALDHPTFEFWTEKFDGGEKDTGVWRGRVGWPDVEAEIPADYDRYELVFTPDGLTETADYTSGVLEAPYEFDYTVGIESSQPIRDQIPSLDTNGDDARSLTFETDPLAEPLEMTGTGRATIRLQSTVSDPTLSVRIVDVTPGGSAAQVTHGTIRVSRRKGLSTWRPLEAGEEYTVTVPLEPASHLFEAGHRIRMAISAARFPEVMPTGEHGQYTILSAPNKPSTIRFAGKSYEDAGFGDAIEMAQPDSSFPTKASGITGSDLSYETTRERTTDEGSINMVEHRFVETPEVAINRRGEYEASVLADDPRSVVANSEMEMELDYDDLIVRISTSNRISRDVCAVSTTVSVDDQEIFDQSWTQFIGK